MDWTDSEVYNGYVRLTTCGYDSQSGLQETVTIGISKSGSDTYTVTTGTYYDAMGRRIYLAENQDDFDPDTLSTIGDGSDDSKDRVTAWEYGGLGQVTTLTAYNGSSSDAQITEYEYEDAVDASLVTLTAYPDGSTSGSDNVQMTYFLDGTVETQTDQRGTMITYTYNSRRQLEYQDVTTLGGVDDAVRSIGRT